jgi:hypothetical protein
MMSRYDMSETEYFIQTITAHAYGDFVKETKESFRNLKRLLEDTENKSVIFIGAGTSFEAELGWTIVKTCLYQCFDGICSTEQVDREYDTDGRGGHLWEKLESDERALMFKELFSNQVKGKKGQKIHGYLRDFIKKHNKVEHLVCFNWDNLIEDKQGFNVNIYNGTEDCTGGGIIWKPCGCVMRTDLPWVFPHKNEKRERKKIMSYIYNDLLYRVW